MGEIARVDLEELRSLADRVTAAAGVVTELRPTALGDGLTGSAAAAAVAGQPLGDRVADVAAGLRGWAQAARQSADALEQADRAHTGRFFLR
ncbi:DUF7162 family protein [Mycolicibacterium poriferae]|uniref:DUF7162 family protein n=1 Tax=Mycolicibacterium poriferae TaxID=39694 RepID=UPI0024BA7E40|nr:hypothetical protein [Mycolicibacterium poriferae]